MTQLRPGKRRVSFVDRCTKDLNDCLLEELGDDALICGVAVRVVLDQEVEKFGFGDGPQQVGEVITLSWLKKDQPNARAEDPVKFRGRALKIKAGYPMDLRDCWLMAELADCGACK